MEKYKGYILIASAATLWGVLGPISSMAFAQGISPLEVAFWRAVLSFIMFGAHAGFTGQVRAEARDLPVFFLFGILGITVFYGSLQLSVKNGGIAMASVLLYTAPAWVAILARIIFKEKITRTKLLALALTLFGVAAVSVGTGGSGADFTFNSFALVCGLVSGFSYALYYIMGKHFSGKYNSPTLFLYMMPVGAAGLYPFITFSTKTPEAWLWLILLSLLCTYGAYYLYYQGLKYLEPTRAVITATLEPFVAAVVAYIWWNESFNLLGYGGSVLIISSVLLMIMDENSSGNDLKEER